MMHQKRIYQVADVDSAEELTERLTAHSWTLCTAFRLGDVVYANDSFGEDSLQEYAAIRDGRQIESITVSWTSEERLEAILEELARGGGIDMGSCMPRLEEADDYGRCWHCA
jgi:hypothetical protein